MSDVISRHNVLYFGDELDIRLIPKNCSSTLKILWTLMNNEKPRVADLGNPHGYWPSHGAERYQRQKAIHLNNDQLWRTTAKKVAIKRDPIDRWLSVMNFSYEMKEYVSYRLYKGFDVPQSYRHYLDLPYLELGINHAVDYHKQVGILCPESVSQFSCAGNAEQYDYIFDQKEFSKCVELIEDLCRYSFHKFERNIQATKVKIKRFEKRDLTKRSIDTIMEIIYAEDYATGWG